MKFEEYLNGKNIRYHEKIEIEYLSQILEVMM